MKKIVGMLTVVSLAVIAFVSTGCGAGNVANVKKPLKPGAVNRRQAILVRDFDTANTVFTGDNATDPNVVNAQKRRISSLITFSLVSKLTEAGFNVHGFDEKKAQDSVVADEVIIDGVITRVNHGSGAARYLVGFGAGSAWIQAEVKIYESQNPNTVLAEFQSESSSQGSAAPMDLTDQLVRDLAKAITRYIAANSK